MVTFDQFAQAILHDLELLRHIEMLLSDVYDTSVQHVFTDVITRSPR